MITHEDKKTKTASGLCAFCAGRFAGFGHMLVHTLAELQRMINNPCPSVLDPERVAEVAALVEQIRVASAAVSRLMRDNLDEDAQHDCGEPVAVGVVNQRLASDVEEGH